MKTLKIRHIKFCPVIGIGFWVDKYNLPDAGGFAINIVLPFVRVQIGELMFKKSAQK